MRTEDKILDILALRSTPRMGGRFATTELQELQEKLEVPNEEMSLACGFLEKYGLIVVADGVVQITTRGLQLLNLPSLPEDEITGEEITELTLIEQKMTDKTINLYPLSQHTETANWIDAMAIRFNVSGNDVIRAMWAIAKDSVGAKLERDVKDLKKRQTGFSEATINSIRTREDKRQKIIAGATGETGVNE